MSFDKLLEDLGFSKPEADGLAKLYEHVHAILRKPVYEYRALIQRPDRPFPDERFRARSDDRMWTEWKGEPANPDGDGPPVDTTDLSGVEGLARATVREHLAWAVRDGDILSGWVERRVVGEWERIDG